MVTQAHNNAVIRFGMGLLACGWMVGCGAHAQGGDACGAGASCEAWEVCVGGVCRASCKADSDCPVAQVCEAALCVDGVAAESSSSSSTATSFSAASSSSSSATSVASVSSASSSSAAASSSVSSAASTSSSSSGGACNCPAPADGCFVATCGAGGTCETAYKCTADEVCAGPSNTCEPLNNSNCSVDVVGTRAFVLCHRTLLGWTSAQAMCTAWTDFSVASIRNQAEQDRLQARAGLTKVWLGFTIPNMPGEFEWMDHSPAAAFTQWCGGAPQNETGNEACAMASGSCWHDTGCDFPWGADAVVCSRADR